MERKELLKCVSIIICVFILSACDSSRTTIEKSEEKLSIDEAKKLIWATQAFSESSDKEVEMIEITSSDIWEHTKCQLFKLAGETYLVANNQEVVRIGNGFGGYGVTSAVPYDVNKDGFSDIIYAYSFGSGINRSIISWIDLENLEEHVVEDIPRRTTFRMYDLILKNEKDKTVVYRIMDRTKGELLQTFPTDKDISQMTLKKDGILIWEDGRLFNKQL